MAFYYLGIRIYSFLIFLFSKFNAKAKRFLNGRKNWEQNYSASFHAITQPVLWMHCASVGEFEQGRVLLENLGTLKKDYFVLLTFFSPSGYELRKNYEYADCIQFLPLDHLGAASRFLAIVKPTIAIFVKYEIWLGYFSELKKQGIATYLICAKFRINQVYFRWYAGVYKRALGHIDHIFVQTNQDGEILSQNNLHNYSVAGDLRFERVLAVKAKPYENKIIANFIQQKASILIAGSTWSADEQLLITFLKKAKHLNLNFQLIIAPHEIDASHLNRLTSLIEHQNLSFQLYSGYQARPNQAHDVLIIDHIGELSKIYRYSHFNYVGGGFGKGIHNILEPAVYGNPIFFGPNYEKFAEAHLLIENTCAFSIENVESLVQIMIKIGKAPQQLEDIKAKLSLIFEQNKLSLEIIKSGIFQKNNSINIYKSSN